jgi:exopolyphosphatase/guanosine-5'-triphosphate,3'-diphosphate pyrophosphatase
MRRRRRADAPQVAEGGAQEIAAARASRGRTFYMVGGSWRALARIDMLATDFPLPITTNTG